jgi:hypothetical protein
MNPMTSIVTRSGSPGENQDNFTQATSPTGGFVSKMLAGAPSSKFSLDKTRPRKAVEMRKLKNKESEEI